MNRSILRTTALSAVGALFLLPLAACNSPARTDTIANNIAAETPDSLSPLPRTHSAEEDVERLTLGRLLGPWSFDGWTDPIDEARHNPAGLATGRIDQRFFLSLDFNYTLVQGSADRRSGTMLFGSEPVNGVTLNAWFDSSIAQSRFAGRASDDGSVIVLDELVTANAAQQIRMIIKFRSDTEWTADFIDLKQNGDPVVGSLTFRRSG